MSNIREMALDWTLLFELTSRYHGVDIPKQFIVMSMEDSQWIRYQIDAAKFEDNDNIKQVVESLIEESKSMQSRLLNKYGGGPADELDEDEVLRLFEELTELVEQSA